MMNPSDKVYVAGHNGLVGSAICRRLESLGYSRIVKKRSSELDLRDRKSTELFFENEKPDHVFLAAAKVGGILANRNQPVDFLKENLAIQNNVIDSCFKTKVKRLLFLGSSCIYPKMAPQPLKENSLLSGPLESTNRPYALAKIAGIEMCWSYNRQHNTKFLAAMPTNLYGPGDNYDPKHSHVIPGMIGRFHQAKSENKNEVVVWGTGKPKREFMYSEDMARACVFLMESETKVFDSLLGSTKIQEEEFNPPLINIGTGVDLSIAELSRLVKSIVGFEGKISFDHSKPDGTPRKLMDVSRLQSLGFKSETSLEEGLSKAYEDFKKATAG